MFFSIKPSVTPFHSPILTNRLTGLLFVVAIISLTIPFSLTYAANLIEQPVSFEPAEKIQLSAKNFLEEITNAADKSSIEVKIGKLDPRLRLRRCNNPLQSFLAHGSKPLGRVTVGVRCDLPVAWKVFVSATVDQYAQLVVAKININRKTTITAQDIELKRVKVSSLRKQPIFELKKVVNTRSKSYLRSGSIVFESSVCMVCRGDLVEISAKNEFFNLNLKGIALADASLGEHTLVRNSQSKRSFSAKVIGNNRLEVTLAATR